MPHIAGNLDLRALGPVIDLLLGPSEQFMKANKVSNPLMVQVVGMIDTGAATTLIKEGVAKSLGLLPVSTVCIGTATSDGVECLQYDMSVLFPTNAKIGSLLVTEAPLRGQHIQCLIGRDILANAVLVYIGHANSFSLSL